MEELCLQISIRHAVQRQVSTLTVPAPPIDPHQLPACHTLRSIPEIYAIVRLSVLVVLQYLG